MQQLIHRVEHSSDDLYSSEINDDKEDQYQNLAGKKQKVFF